MNKADKKFSSDLVSKGIAANDHQWATFHVTVGSSDARNVDRNVRLLASALGAEGVEKAVLRNWPNQGETYTVGYNLTVPRITKIAIEIIWKKLSNAELSSDDIKRLLGIVADLRRRGLNGEGLQAYLATDPWLSRILIEAHRRGIGAAALLGLVFSILNFLGLSRPQPITITINNYPIESKRISGAETKRKRTRKGPAKKAKPKRHSTPKKQPSS